MRAAELRIGNYLLNYEGEPQKVTGNDIRVWDRNGILNGIKPIPLTEEWLVKFGFKEHLYQPNNQYLHSNSNLEKGWFVPNNYTDHITLDENGCHWFNNHSSIGVPVCSYNILYVHQLQNLYFALTNTELTIK